MKKLLAVAVAFVLAAPAFAAAKAKTAEKTPARPSVEFIVIESDEYAAGKVDMPMAHAVANFLGGDAKVTPVSYQQAKQNPEYANMDMSYLPLYLLKTTPQYREKLTQHIAVGQVLERGEYLVFPHLSNSGVYQDKVANPGVLEIFVMSQCPFGAMAENLVIDAMKAGKLPADKVIKLRYIVSYNEQNGFQSLHGAGEWEENVRQLLIAKYYPAKLWKYLEIRNKDYSPSRWEKAMEEAGINIKKITKKFDTEGIELLKKEAAYSDEYGINASPSFLYEGKEKLDFGSVSQKPGFEFLNPSNANRGGGQAAPVGSC